MSEFTNGVLVRLVDLERAAGQFDQAGLVFRHRALNERWGVLFLLDEWFSDPTTAERLLAVSSRVALLYVWNAEDHGWGYRLFADGREAAGVSVDYELNTNAAMDIFLAEHPEKDPYDLENQPLMARAFARAAGEPAYAQAVAQQYAQANVEETDSGHRGVLLDGLSRGG